VTTGGTPWASGPVHSALRGRESDIGPGPRRPGLPAATRNRPRVAATTNVSRTASHSSGESIIRFVPQSGAVRLARLQTHQGSHARRRTIHVATLAHPVTATTAAIHRVRCNGHKQERHRWTGVVDVIRRLDRNRRRRLRTTPSSDPGLRGRACWSLDVRGIVAQIQRKRWIGPAHFGHFHAYYVRETDSARRPVSTVLRPGVPLTRLVGLRSIRGDTA